MTLRNFGWLTITMLIVFAIVTVRSEMRGRHLNDYGRLLGHQMDAKVETKPVEVVEETPQAEASVSSEPPSQPMMIVPVDQPPLSEAPALASQLPPARDEKVAIVGGPEGVTIVKQAPRRPVLSGGFGRP